MKNRDRKHVWQCQLFINGVWVDRLKKPYPRKSALAEKEYLFLKAGVPLEHIRIVDTNQTRVTP
jgi:hypothetical protein